MASILTDYPEPYMEALTVRDYNPFIEKAIKGGDKAVTIRDEAKAKEVSALLAELNMATAHWGKTRKSDRNAFRNRVERRIGLPRLPCVASPGLRHECPLRAFAVHRARWTG